MKKNKIKIYQYFLSQRIFAIIGVTCLLVLTILNIKSLFVDFWILSLWLLFLILGVYIPFSSYICLNEEENTITFREELGRKTIVSLDKLKGLYLNINPKNEKDFAIDVIYDNEVKRFGYWAKQRRHVAINNFFTVTSRYQRKRLQRFIDQCNEYLEIYQRTIASESQEIQEQNKENFSNDNE